jgi:hypothetical protein
VQQVGERSFQLMLETASGGGTKSESFDFGTTIQAAPRQSELRRGLTPLGDAPYSNRLLSVPARRCTSTGTASSNFRFTFSA